MVFEGGMITIFSGPADEQREQERDVQEKEDTTDGLR